MPRKAEARWQRELPDGWKGQGRIMVDGDRPSPVVTGLVIAAVLGLGYIIVFGIFILTQGR